MNLQNTCALVTGGASGLGAATARALAHAGARVGVLDLNETKGTALAESIGGLFTACDVADESSAMRAIERITDAFGSPRILVQCAGVGGAARVVGRDGPMELAMFEQIIRVNLTGTFNMVRLAAASMSSLEPVEGNRGVIIMTASIAAFEGQIGQAAYSASKGGIAALTLPVARELARFGIRVLTIAPGLFRTPLLEELPADAQASLAANIPFPARLGTPEEFASLALAMIDNDYLNGETIRLDGGLRLQSK